MRFVKVDEDVVSVEMSVDTIERIAAAFGAHTAENLTGSESDERDEVLFKTFSTAAERFGNLVDEEPVAIDG